MHAVCMGALFDWHLGSLGLEVGSWLDAIANMEFCRAVTAALEDPSSGVPRVLWGPEGWMVQVRTACGFALPG
jgi:hypothetical protein